LRQHAGAYASRFFTNDAYGVLLPLPFRGRRGLHAFVGYLKRRFSNTKALPVEPTGPFNARADVTSAALTYIPSIPLPFLRLVGHPCHIRYLSSFATRHVRNINFSACVPTTLRTHATTFPPEMALARLLPAILAAITSTATGCPGNVLGVLGSEDMWGCFLPAFPPAPPQITTSGMVTSGSLWACLLLRTKRLFYKPFCLLAIPLQPRFLYPLFCLFLSCRRVTGTALQRHRDGELSTRRGRRFSGAMVFFRDAVGAASAYARVGSLESGYGRH